MKFNYKGPRRLGALGYRSATQESLRSTAIRCYDERFEKIVTPINSNRYIYRFWLDIL